jgi:competence protein ComEA
MIIDLDLLRQKSYLILGATGLALMTGAIFLNHIRNDEIISAGERGQQKTGSPQVEATSFSRKSIKVDVEGAVERPGIYEIPNDSRIGDVLITAGGLGAKADRTYVSKNINLAQMVYDGQKIFIPEANSLSDLSPLSSLSNLININAASEAELDTLPGIGPVTAKKIITGRPYQTISQLVEKHLVSQATYEKIKDLLRVN